MKYRSLLFAALLALAACSEEAQPPPKAVTMTEEAVGHYCQMLVLEHKGPKAQVHIAGQDHPLWFSQVRDAIAFLRSPEETAQVRAVYVNDMARAKTWDEPGVDNWIAADQAYFVIAGKMTGGMGAPEAVPFGDEAAALAHIATHGGKLVRLADIPDDYVLAPVDVPGTRSHQPGTHGTQSHDMQSHDLNAHGTQTQ
jgi:copper chaperone NosL